MTKEQSEDKNEYLYIKNRKANIKKKNQQKHWSIKSREVSQGSKPKRQREGN